jgi:hypothetical protein
MWSSAASKGGALALLALFAPARGAGQAFWSAALVNEPYFIGGTFHPSLQGAGKLDFGRFFRAQTRLSLSGEVYGLFEPERTPRAWEATWGALCGLPLPIWRGDLEASAGIGAVLGRKQGDLYFRHEWGGGLFSENTLEYGERLYADVGIPFQVQWLFGKRRKGLGVAYSGFLSREVKRWGVGIYWQSFLGRPVAPKASRYSRPAGSPPAGPPASPIGPDESGRGTEELE